MPTPDPVEIHYEHGTVVVPVLPDDVDLSQWLSADDRTGVFRAPAFNYRDIMLSLHRAKVPYVDKARAFDPIPMALQQPIDPFPHQKAALDAWAAVEGRGVVELPTGSGKTLLAVLAMVRVKRPTLVLVPTLDLLAQWQEVLSQRLGQPIGMLGGGERDRQPITVSTYDSAALTADFLGNQFGLLVFDECHHLPAPAYQFIAAGSIAPYRLGLTATLARADGGEDALDGIVGPLCYSVPIDELEGTYLAPYDVVVRNVSFTEDEQARYDEARSRYLSFLRKSGVSLSRPDGWAQFIARTQRTDEGRRALRAYREQRRIAFTCSAKIDALWQVLLEHKDDRAIVFTEDNETVYRLSTQFLFGVITHQTRPAERKKLLSAFADGRLRVLLTSKVLNEGVDVPDANVGVVLSGSGSVREHVQRLGRILRKVPGKRAVLYEICTGESAEASVGERRRQHRAYQNREKKRGGGQGC